MLDVMSSNDLTPSSPANIYLFKVNNRNTSERCEICSKQTIKTPKQRHWCGSGVWTYFTPFSSVSVVAFEQLNVSWEKTKSSAKISLKKQWFWSFQWNGNLYQFLCLKKIIIKQKKKKLVWGYLRVWGVVAKFCF